MKCKTLLDLGIRCNEEKGHGRENEYAECGKYCEIARYCHCEVLDISYGQRTRGFWVGLA